MPVPPWRILTDYRSFSRFGARTTIPQPGASVYGSALHIPRAFAEDCAKERAFAPSPALQRRNLHDSPIVQPPWRAVVDGTHIFPRRDAESGAELA